MIEKLERSLDQVRPVMAATSPDQLGLPTPCTDWTVRDLVNHCIGALAMFRDAADRGQADPEAMTTDYAAGDVGEAFDAVASATVASLRRKGTEGTITLPFGELPCEFAYGLIADDVLVHGWDLARATGQRVEWDQGHAADVLAFARAGLSDPEVRGAEFATPVACRPGADPMTELVAFLGRTP